MNDIRDLNNLMARLESLLNNVHQYVGARYVPNFKDDPWNDTTSYEALDVVDNGEGTSYIARKPVPAGTPLSNRRYWFLYGSTSGAIINLQRQIDALKSHFNAINLSMFKDKSICIVGDSLSDETTQQPNWVDNFTSIVEGAGATVNNVSVSGSSVVGWGSSPANIPTGYDIYIIALGINDFQGQFSQSAIQTAIEQIINRIDLSDPDRKAFYISPLKAFIPTFTNMYTPIAVYRHLFETIFAKYGCQIISGGIFPNLSNLTNDVYVATDNIHLTPTYAPIYASHVLDVMISGSSETANAYGYVKSCEIHPDLVYTQGNAYLTWEDGNHYTFTLNLFGVEATALSWLPLCKVSNDANGGLIDNLHEYTITSYTGTVYQYRINNGYIEVATPTTGTFNLVCKLTGALTISPSFV